MPHAVVRAGLGCCSEPGVAMQILAVIAIALIAQARFTIADPTASASFAAAGTRRAALV